MKTLIIALLFVASSTAYTQQAPVHDQVSEEQIQPLNDRPAMAISFNLIAWMIEEGWL